MYDDAVETYERNGVKVTLYRDDQPFSPAEWDNLGTLYLETRDYTLQEQVDLTHDTAVWIRAHRIAGHAVIPVYFADRGSGGASLYETTDDRANGFIVALPENIEMTGAPTDNPDIPLIENLRSDLNEWIQYIEGDVYGYVIEAPDGRTLDSLWGLYGWDYAKEEADRAADSLAPEDVYLTERETIRTWG